MRRMAIAFVALVAVLVVLAFGAYAWLTSSDGRVWLARRLEDAVAGQVRGSLAIGDIARLDGFAADVIDVRFLDPRGREVIRVAEAHLALDPLALFDHELRFQEGLARGVRVRIAPGLHGFSTSIEETFSSSGGRRLSGKAPFDIDTGTLVVRRAALLVAMHGPHVRLDGLDGSLRITRHDADPVRVDLGRFRGRWYLPDARVLVDDPRAFLARGVVRGRHEPVVDLRIRACFRRGEIPVRLTFGTGGLLLRFDARDNRFVGMGLGLAGTLSGKIRTERGEVSLLGLPRC